MGQVGDDLAEISAALLAKRVGLNQQLRKVNAALRALDDDDIGSVSHGPRLAANVRRGAPSVRTRILSLLEEDPSRDWSTQEIVREYERRGAPIQAKDPHNAVRTGLSEAMKAAQIDRIHVGRYRVSGPLDHLRPAEQLAPEINSEQESEQEAISQAN
jgi:hypothetical protein